MFKKLLIIPILLILSGCTSDTINNYNIDLKVYENIGGVKALTTIQVAAPGNIVPAGEWVRFPLPNSDSTYDVFTARLASIEKASKEEASTMYSLNQSLQGQDIWIIKVEAKKEIGSETFDIGSMFLPVNKDGDKVQEIIYENWSPCDKSASVSLEGTTVVACYIASSHSSSLIPAGISFVGVEGLNIDYSYETGKPIIMRVN